MPCGRDFNINNHPSNPLRVISRPKELASAPYYFDRTTDLAYTILNSLGVYTRFPLEAQHRPSLIDLAFTNLLLFPTFASWDSSSIPSTGSDHVPIKIIVSSPTNDHAPRATCGPRLTPRR